MSGPKSYNVSVFNENLLNIFNLQAKIELIWGSICKFSFEDKKRSISFNKSEYVQQNKRKVSSSIKKFDLEYKGSVSPEIYRRLNSILANKYSELANLYAELEAVKLECDSLMKDFDCYVNFEIIVNNAKKDIEEYRDSVINYFKKRQDQFDINELEKYIRDLNSIEVIYELPAFVQDFKQISEKEIISLNNKLQSAKEKINEIRLKLGSAILESLNIESKQVQKDKTSTDKGKTKVIPEVIWETIRSIEALLLKITDEQKIKKFRDSLIKYQENFPGEVFYFRELHDNILEYLEDKKNREQLRYYIKIVSKEIKNESMKQEVNKFLQQCNGTLSKEKVKYKVVNSLESAFNYLIEKNRKLIEIEIQRIKENIYIKDQVINALKDLNYDVMSEATVIDLENDCDFLLSTPDGENFVNLRIDSTGELKYNFLIEEDKKSLSDREINNKLESCRKACKDLKTVSRDLEYFGVKLNLIKDNPINENALLKLNSRQLKLVFQKPKKAKKLDEEIKLKRKSKGD